jgi:hypothetical protein
LIIRNKIFDNFFFEPGSINTIKLLLRRTLVL